MALHTPQVANTGEHRETAGDKRGVQQPQEHRRRGSQNRPGSLPAAHQRGSTHLACWPPVPSCDLLPPSRGHALPQPQTPADTSPGHSHAALRVQLSLADEQSKAPRPHSHRAGQSHRRQGRALRPLGSRAEVNGAVSKVTFRGREPVLGSQPQPEGQRAGSEKPNPRQNRPIRGLRGDRGRGYREGAREKVGRFL